jgi:formate hydrogenlyase subunit 4
MRLRSFTTVAIRLMGLLSIFYGLITLIFIAMTMFVFSDMAGGGRYPGMGSMLALQFLLPALMLIFGIILIAASRSLADSISGGLEDEPAYAPMNRDVGVSNENINP